MAAQCVIPVFQASTCLFALYGSTLEILLDISLRTFFDTKNSITHGAAKINHINLCIASS
jgi:hypothetical protein